MRLMIENVTKSKLRLLWFNIQQRRTFRNGPLIYVTLPATLLCDHPAKKSKKLHEVAKCNERNLV